MEIYSEGQYYYINGKGTSQVVTGRCLLVGITVNKTDNGTITIYDEIGSGTTTKIGTLVANVAEKSYPYGVTACNGIKIVTTASPDVTVIYRVI